MRSFAHRCVRAVRTPLCTLLLAGALLAPGSPAAQAEFQIVWVLVGEATSADGSGTVRAGRRLFDVSDLAELTLENVRIARVDVDPVVTELSVGDRWCLSSLQVRALGADGAVTPGAPLSVTVRQDHREYIGLQRTRKNICLRPSHPGEYPVRLTSLLPAPDGSTRGAQIFLRVTDPAAATPAAAN